MLREYLQENGALLWASWCSVMAGVQVCRFSVPPSGAVLPPALEPLHFETLFCLRGSLLLERTGGRTLSVGSQEVLLLSGSSSLTGARTDGPLEGLLVEVDACEARESLRTLCGLMGDLRLDIGAVRRTMAGHEGCAVLKRAPWSRAVFDALPSLDGREQGRYCVWKTVELLYLLCCGGDLLKQRAPFPQPEGDTGEEMGAYLICHLGEKLTIPALSRRFCLSPTAFKTRFRHAYGQPVHSWLQERRMERAAQLLHDSSMTVLQVAQSVGYDGVSQFNAAFKQRYGMTPRAYRKMSDSGACRPFP